MNMSWVVTKVMRLVVDGGEMFVRERNEKWGSYEGRGPSFRGSLSKHRKRHEFYGFWGVSGDERHGVGAELLQNGTGNGVGGTFGGNGEKIMLPERWEKRSLLAVG
jgi:hypothetical protein